MGSIDLEAITQESVELARKWQQTANALTTSEERKAQRRMARLLAHPTDKVLLMRMLDQCFRSSNSSRVADQMHALLVDYGMPHFLSPSERILFRLFMHVGRHLPLISVPAIIGRIRKDGGRTIIPGEKNPFLNYMARRKAEGVRVNINRLGEAVLGKKECARRMESYCSDLKNPSIEQISIKISTICCQIQSLAFDQTVEELAERLGRIYRTARDHHFSKPDGTTKPKFVNLDMEAYRDLDLTVAAFVKALEAPDLKSLSAGIALQAYMPDSSRKMQELTAWATARVAEGGAPIGIRVVKGANLQMEQLEASLMSWPLATYGSKLEVDANFKRMVLFAMQPEHISAVHLGIASHNLFDQAFAHAVARHYGVEDMVTCEMLEGMDDPIRCAVQQTFNDVLLYAPIAVKKQFIHAIAYLVRRLDENTGSENFLRYACELSPDSETWVFLQKQFLDSVAAIDRISSEPNRTQDRSTETFPATMGTYHEGRFNNEPNTDWCRPGNRAWAEAIRDKWMNIAKAGPLRVPAVVDGEELFEGRTILRSIDPSREKELIHTYDQALATVEDAERAIATAAADPDGWRTKTYPERNAILSKVAMELRKNRGDLIGAAALDTGKVFSESDVEVSEAIDFAEFYPFTAQAFDHLENIEARPEGVGVVISPWNFPIAIPCGGMLSMLAAGNTVIFKPALESALVAYELCKCIWRAGVSRKTLQFLPGQGPSVGGTLAQHPAVNCVIFTGSTETGMAIVKKRPDIHLAAETGGKNSTIVTALSDRDQAIANVIHSAFSNSGQKCSATSLLILEKEVYHDPQFRQQLVDAAQSMATGSAWDFRNRVAPLIKPPSDKLLRGLTELEAGEEWALQPECVDGNPYLWSPGIKWGVQRGSFTHRTELFGPVLGVMCANDLDEAVDIANEPGYGLTAGLESLDRREQEYWKERIIAGNLYINRGTTGAIVLRQPFGGMRKSAIGAGIKAGGPNYVSQFVKFKDTGDPQTGPVINAHPLLSILQEWRSKLDSGSLAEYADDLNKTIRATESYLYQYEQEFGVEKDYFQLRGQDNIVRYLPIGTVMVRVHPDDSLFEVLARCTAVLVSRCKLILSIPEGLGNAVMSFIRNKGCENLFKQSEVVHEDDATVAGRIGAVQRIRYAAADRVPELVYRRAAESGFYIARASVMMEGRIELLHYFREQSVCTNYHRYGNLGDRSIE